MKPSLASVEIDGVLLSPQQKRLWRLGQEERLRPGEGLATAYRTRGALWIDGPVDTEALRLAFAELIGRHEILRTGFRCPHGMTTPLQVIGEGGKLAFEDLDLSGRGEPDQQAELARLWAAPLRPFDLENGPLLRLTLVTLSPHRHVCRAELPALCADAVGLRCLLREAGHLYEGLVAGRKEAGEVLQYADLSGWLNEMLEAEEAEAGRAFWRSRGSEDLSPLWLGTQGGKPTGGFQPASLLLDLSAAETADLVALAGRLDAAPGDLLLALWAAFAGRLARRSTVLVATTFAGRDYAELEAVVGLFARALPVRCEVAETLRLRDLVAQARQGLEDARHWQECFSWDLLPAAAQANGEPFLPLAFEHAEETESLTAAGARFAVRDLSSRFERFELKLCSARSPEGYRLCLEYDAARLAAEDAQGAGERFRALLASAVRQPEAEIGDWELLPEAERQHLLIDLQPVPAAQLGAEGPLMHRLFEAQAAAHPERPVLADENRTMSYGELEARSARLARRLRSLGAGPGMVVAVCLDRSLEVVVAILGALRAGAAYAPLDPAQPPQRLGFMLEDLQAAVVIAEKRGAERLPPSGAAVLILDEEDPAGEEGDSPARPFLEPAAEDLAYVIFTSGSTGRPKGVGVEHRQLRAYVQAIVDRMTLPEAARFALVSTFAADLGHTVLFPALASGGCLDVVSHARASDPVSLAESFSARRIDCLKIVPGHLGALLAGSLEREILPRAQLVLGGEPCSWELVERIRSLEPGCSILNHYGPTETTVGVLTHRIEEAADRAHGARVPLGRPLAGTRVYLAGPRLRLAPAGAVGEICVGGHTVARGYVNRPALTAERFLPDPFSGEPGARLYRTGDLGRLLPDGAIEFLGRADQQIKIRGFRIEPGEIEAALARLPGVREAVVVSREDGGTGRRLVAYVEPAPDARLDGQRLRDALAQALPEVMVPAAVVVLAVFPRTSNGKVDRQALPTPQQTCGDGAAAPPRNQAEETLLRIWESVLGREGFGVHDNFFELGGDSILSIQVVARANRAGLRLTPRQAFEHQTVAELAAIAGTGALSHAEQGVVEGPVPLTPIQQAFFEQSLAEPHHWNQSVLLATRDRLDAPRLRRVLGRLLRHHDALRLRFRREAGGWIQVNAAPDGDVPLSRIDLSAIPPELRAAGLERGAADAQRSLDLARGPLLRAALFDLGPEEGERFLLAVHHLAVDGVSWRILLADLEAGYRSPGDGASFDLPAKTTSFRRWAELLNEHARTQMTEQDLDEWRREPAGGCARLPVDSPGAVPAAGSARQVSISLDGDETRALLQEIPRVYQTQIQDVLLAALARSLAPWTGDRPVRVDLEGHGREEIFEGIDLSRTVGWFTTIYPVILDSAAGRPEGEVLVAVKERLRAVPGRGIGYGLLRHLGPEEARRELASLAPAEIRFNYLGQLDDVLPETALFTLASAPRGPERSPLAPPRYLIDLLGSVAGGCLRVSWTYSENVHRRATVEALAQRFLETLRSLIRHCRPVAAERQNPADFPDVELDQRSFDLLLAELGDEI